MIQIKFLKKLFMLSLAFAALIFVGCNEDDDMSQDIEVRVNGEVIFEPGDDFFGDVDGDFTGNGGSGVRTFTWMNALPTADYNADITATTDGRFNIVVIDSEDKVVLDRSLEGGREPDSIDGVTRIGKIGLWTVTITLTNFDGDGSFSLSQGT